MTLPAKLTVFPPDPTPNTLRNDPTNSLSGAIGGLRTAVEGIEAVIGTTGSADPASVEYRLGEAAAHAAAAAPHTGHATPADVGAAVAAHAGANSAHTKEQVGLSAVDNTSDANKPVSGPQAAAIAAAQAAAQAASAPLAQVGRVASAGRNAAAALASALRDGRSVAIQVLGDSTGNDLTEWPRLIAEQLAADFPAFTVKTRLFSDATQSYAAPVTIQTGPLGERYMDGATGTRPRRLAAALSQHLSGTIDFRTRMRLANWVPGAQVNVGGKSGVAGARGWYAYINSAGTPYFAFSMDGSALLTMAATASLSVAPSADSWVRWLFTPDDGAGNRVFKAFTSTDGQTWAQLGATVTTAGAVTLFDNATVGYECGGIATSAVIRFDRLYEMEIRDGENGRIVAPVLPELWPPYDSSSAYFAGSPVLTIVNGSIPGAGITGGGTILADTARLAKMTPDYGQALVFLSTSHNDGFEHGRLYRSTYEAWVASVRAALPGVPLVVLAQNPETGGATWNREHAWRRFDLLRLAADKSWAAIDIAAAFLANPSWAGDYMADAVHPNAAGQAVWGAEIMRFIDAARVN